MSDINLEYYNTLIKVHKYIEDYSKSNQKAFELFGLPGLGEKKSKKKNPLNDYLDNLYVFIENACFFALIADFEKQLFKKLENASGEIKKNVNNLLDKTIPFNECEENFIKTQEDVDRLSKISQLMKSKISVNLYNCLNDFIEYRNYIAHGKRFSSSAKVLSFHTKYSMQKVADVLRNILINI